MGLGDVWSRALVYFGIVEEEEYWDEEGFAAEDELAQTYNDRPNVRRLRELAETHGLPQLSMGTSQDFRVAVEEGATVVRVGSALLGR